VPALAACLVVVLAVREVPRQRPTAGRLRGGPPVLSRPFLAYLGSVVLFGLGNSSDAFLLLRAHDAGLPLQAAPLIWAAHHVVKSVAAAWGGGLADRFGRRRALALGWLVYAAIYAGFAAARGGTAIIVLFVVYGLHFGLAGGAQKALVAEVVPVEARARGYGIYHLCVGLTALPASVLFGALYVRLGAPAAFLTGAALSLAAAALLPLSRGERGEDRP
jgi:MFS family permease